MDEGEGRRYWFRAKRYGWGWGLPSAWQGWVVLLGYVALLTRGLNALRAGSMSAGLFAPYVLVLTALLVVICWRTGEPPGWRWGDPAAVSDAAGEDARPATAPVDPVSVPRWILLLHLTLGPLLLGIFIYIRLHLPLPHNGYLPGPGPERAAWLSEQRYVMTMLIMAATIVCGYQAVSIAVLRPIVSVLTSAAILAAILAASVSLIQTHLRKTLAPPPPGTRTTLLQPNTPHGWFTTIDPPPLTQISDPTSSEFSARVSGSMQRSRTATLCALYTSHTALLYTPHPARYGVV